MRGHSCGWYLLGRLCGRFDNAQHSLIKILDIAVQAGDRCELYTVASLEEGVELCAVSFEVSDWVSSLEDLLAGHIGGSNVEATFYIATEGLGNCKAEDLTLFRRREGKLDLVKLRVRDLMRGWRILT